MAENTVVATVIDDMSGLYTHASEAYRAGKVAGRDEFYRSVRVSLATLSVKHERGEDPAAFHTAEEACAILRELKTAFDARKETL